MRLIAFALTAVLAPLSAMADPCEDEVQEVFQTSLYSYDRPPYRSEKSVYDAQGALQHVFVSSVETPLRTLSGVKGDSMALVIDRQVWTGPSATGPWTEAPSNFPADRKAAHDKAFAQQLANLDEIECNGLVEMDGVSLLSYSFSTQTDPDPDQGGLYFGERSTVYLDPETRRVMRWEQTDFTTPWMTEPDAALHVTVFTYDPELTVTPPPAS